MSTVFFTSDLHINHDRDFIYAPRGFKSVFESDETLIKNWNSVVTDQDEVFVLGDFCLGADLDYVRKVVSRLHGKIHLYVGNHDSRAKLRLYREEFSDVMDVCQPDYWEYGGYTFYLSHYRTDTFNYHTDRNKQVYNLSGHTHQATKFYDNYPLVYNVAVDAHNNYPVSIEQIIKDIEEHNAKLGI